MKRDRDWDDASVWNELEVERLFYEKARCTCCAIHQMNKPVQIVPWLENNESKMKISNKRMIGDKCLLFCECDCRHVCREICRKYFYNGFFKLNQK